MTPTKPALTIDNLQYNNWSEKIFQQVHQAGIAAIHVTIAYHENFVETIENIIRWNQFFQQYPHLIFQGKTANDVTLAYQQKKCAIFFGFQNPSPIEDNIGLVEVWYQLGVRFMQLTYNNQSLLASGCYEPNDAGISRMGKEVIREMNRLGMVVDMSHSGERSTLEAIEYSTRPIVISHANPSFWHPARRNKSDTVLQALSQSGGMLGCSLYPHHLKNASACTIEDFATMIAQTAEKIGVHNIGIGSDLCQDQPDSIVSWMRNGTWTKHTDYGEGTPDNPGFPRMPPWFKDNRDFPNITQALVRVGFSSQEVDLIVGGNWLKFYEQAFVGLQQ